MPTGRIVCYELEVPYLDEKGWDQNGPERDEDWVESSALAVSQRYFPPSEAEGSEEDESSGA